MKCNKICPYCQTLNDDRIVYCKLDECHWNIGLDCVHTEKELGIIKNE